MARRSHTRRWRWSDHALENLEVRELDRHEVEVTLERPEFVVPGTGGRRVYMRRYRDRRLGCEMLLRIVVEENPRKLVVVTIYRTSQIAKYLKGLEP